jgi:glutamate 5-kinase
MTGTRPEVTGAKRVVVKVGSSSISGANSGQIDPLVDALATLHATGTEVVLVSSGAIATAIPFLKLDGRPTDLATQQAAAAVGQNVLMWRYQTSLDRYSILAGQVLLTAGACSDCGSCRSSTRTTPSRRTRSASATTTAWPRS